MHKKQSRCHKGIVFAMTNEAICNKIVAFHQGPYGRLIGRTREYATGGSGTGMRQVDPLSAQGSLILSPNRRVLFAVNAGSGSISSFRIANSGKLTLVDLKPSGGAQPNSLAAFDNLLYVTNAGNASSNISANITGFHVEKFGDLTPIVGSTRFFSTSTPQPASVVFSPDGNHLVVSELNTNHLSVFNVNMDGTLTGPIINSSNGIGPFGSVFLCNGLLLVSESGSNALSSYVIDAIGALTVISGSITNGQMTTCRVVLSPREHFAYTSNVGSGTITVYRIDKDGTLIVVESVSSTPEGTTAPIDSGVSKFWSNLYVLNGNEGSISVFRIKKGKLILLQVFRDTGLPKVGAQGLAVL